MPISYPSDLPPPLLNNFQAVVNMGVIRSEQPNMQSQRRVHATMPHDFKLSFSLDLVTWAAWSQWVEDNGRSWFYMNLPTLYAGLAEAKLSAVLIRFTSDLPAVPRSLGAFTVSLSAEMAPSMIKLYLAAT